MTLQFAHQLPYFEQNCWRHYTEVFGHWEALSHVYPKRLYAAEALVTQHVFVRHINLPYVREYSYTTIVLLLTYR